MHPGHTVTRIYSKLRFTGLYNTGFPIFLLQSVTCLSGNVDSLAIRSQAPRTLAKLSQTRTIEDRRDAVLLRLHHAWPGFVFFTMHLASWPVFFTEAGSPYLSFTGFDHFITPFVLFEDLI